MSVPCVIIVENNIVSKNILCDGGEHAQKVFKHEWAIYDKNYGNYSEDDIDNTLDEGYIELPAQNVAICLSWAMTEEEHFGADVAS